MPRLHGSWVSPKAAKIKKLLYVSDGSDDVYIYNYKTGAFVGWLSGFLQSSGQCIDAAGNIWISDYVAQAVVEYAHGRTKPLKRIATNGQPDSCSIDPTSGNLAVMNAATPSGEGNVLLFTASGMRSYTNPGCAYNVQLGFDDQGNLYTASTISTNICELVHGGTSLETVTINQTIYGPAGVMWDGKYITFADRSYKGANKSVIYQAERNSSASLTVVATTALNNPCGGGVSPGYFDQPFIVGDANTPKNTKQGKTVVSQDCAGDYSYWSYPAGGDQVKSLFDPPTLEAGESVSIGK